jgi:tetratricopeptide (TPR) repeat protein
VRNSCAKCVEALLVALALLIGGCASAPPAPPPEEVQAAAGAPVEPVVPERAAQEFAQAVAMLEAGRNTDAELELKQLALSYPEFPGPHFNLGLLYERTGRLTDAQQALLEAVKRGLPSAPAYTQLGVVERKLGRFKEAEAAYLDALKVDPGYAPAHLNLGVLCDLYLQQPERALASFERYMELSGNSDKRVATWIAELKGRVGSNPQPQPQTAEASP